MSEIIANTYRIEKKIGSGGSGVVYLAEHMRLGKSVVLKADKRTIKTKPEVLRREVDALKNLSHTYIPQVYDYIVENDTVYTVMDFIDGESLDKPLKRGEHFKQRDVVRWMVQLLEALCYLHSRPPHGILHSDIKPANIMLTSQNDICLIDFNIALALGEEGAVRVGYSHGYASPEHYGLRYSHDGMTEITSQSINTDNSNMTAGQKKSEAIASGASESITKTMPSDEDATMTMPLAEDITRTMAGPQSENSSSNTISKTILLDVRSDIYSLGATLYHLLTGKRPARKFEEIEPISEYDISPALAAIIEKAMAKDADDRFQSAEEMLNAVRNLYRDDPRSQKLRKTQKITAAVIAVFLVSGIASAFIGTNQKENIQNAYVLAEQSADSLRAGDVTGATELALQSLSKTKKFFLNKFLPESQYVLTNALGVYDVSDGFKDYADIVLPSEPVRVNLSENGKYAAAVYLGGTAVIDTEKAEIIKTLKTEPSALSKAVFADNDVLIYAGENAVRAYSISEDRKLWNGEKATGICLSADGKTAAAVYKDSNEAIIYDIRTGEKKANVSFEIHKQPVVVNDVFADPEDAVFELNSDGTMLAASFSDGALMVFNISNPDENLEIYDASEYTHFEGGFFGKYFAFSSTNESESVFAVIDTVDMIQTGGFESTNKFSVQADETGIYIVNENIAVKIDPETGDQQEIAYTDKYISKLARDENHCLAVTDDDMYSYFDVNAEMMSESESEYKYSLLDISSGRSVLGSIDTPALRIMKLESNEEMQIFSYDPDYEHDEVRVSADGKTVMLFKYDQFRLYDKEKNIICDIKIPDAEEVYDQQYRRDEKGSYLEVIYNDGLRRSYSAADGSVISETKGEKPDETIKDEFYTSKFKIEAPVHGTPQVYDIKTGKKVAELESDSYLTYVTEMDDYIITEYINTDGSRYGLLLDKDFKKLALLPDLCDVVEDKLIFDYRIGSVRKSDLYSIEELIDMGNTKAER